MLHSVMRDGSGVCVLVQLEITRNLGCMQLAKEKYADANTEDSFKNLWIRLWEILFSGT